jgi:GTPase involved in cell partitioning and DNA repair
MIDSILLFQSVAESTIQINLTIEELKKIFPFLSNKGLIVVITKFERSYDEQKLKNLKTTLDKKAIPYIEWVNSCSTKCLTNDDYFQN